MRKSAASWKGVPSVPSPYCRHCNQKLVPFDHRPGKIWSVVAGMAAPPRGSDSPLHHPLWEPDISYHHLHCSRVLCGSSHRDFSAFDLVKEWGLGKWSVREETGRTSESARSRYNPSPPPDLIIRSIPPLKICRVSHFNKFSIHYKKQCPLKMNRNWLNISYKRIFILIIQACGTVFL